MRQSGGTEILLQPRIQSAGVADDQAWEQPAGVVRQWFTGFLEPRAQHTGRPLRPRRLPDRLGRFPGREHRGPQVTGPGRHQPSTGGDPLTRKQPPPPRIRPQHQSPSGQPDRRGPFRHDGLEVDGHQEGGWPRGPCERPRVVPDNQFRSYGGTARHQFRQHRSLPHRHPSRRGHSPTPHPEQHRHPDPPNRARPALRRPAPGRGHRPCRPSTSAPRRRPHPARPPTPAP